MMPLQRCRLLFPDLRKYGESCGVYGSYINASECREFSPASVGGGDVKTRGSGATDITSTLDSHIAKALDHNLISSLNCDSDESLQGQQPDSDMTNIS